MSVMVVTSRVNQFHHQFILSWSLRLRSRWVFSPNVMRQTVQSTWRIQSDCCVFLRSIRWWGGWSSVLNVFISKFPSAGCQHYHDHDINIWTSRLQLHSLWLDDSDSSQLLDVSSVFSISRLWAFRILGLLRSHKSIHPTRVPPWVCINFSDFHPAGLLYRCECSLNDNFNSSYVWVKVSVEWTIATNVLNWFVAVSMKREGKSRMATYIFFIIPFLFASVLVFTLDVIAISLYSIDSSHHSVSKIM